MTIALEHFCVGKFLQGQYLRGGYSILAASPGVSRDLARRANQVDILGKGTTTRGLAAFYGFAFFNIHDDIYATAMYQRSGKKEESRAFPIYKHYVIINKEQLEAINFDLNLILQSEPFTKEIITDKKQILPPLEIISSWPKNFISSYATNNLLDLYGLKTVLDRTSAVFRYPQSTARNRLNLVLKWMQLIPLQVAPLLTFTTNTSAQLPGFRICFLDDRATYVDRELNLAEICENKPGVPESFYLNWLSEALQTPEELSLKLAALRLPVLIGGEQLGTVLERSVQLHNWNSVNEVNPSIIKQNKKNFIDLLTPAEQTDLTVRLLLLYFREEDFPSFLEALHIYSNELIDHTAIVQVSRQLPSPIPVKLIEVGLNYTQEKERFMQILEAGLDLSFSQKDYHAAFTTIRNTVSIAKTDAEPIVRIKRHILQLPDNSFKLVLTAILEAQRDYAFDFIQKQFDQQLGDKFPELWQVLQYIHHYYENQKEVDKTPTRTDLLEQLLRSIERDKQPLWAVYSVAYVIRSSCWALLTDFSINKAFKATRGSFEFDKVRSSAWKILRQHLHEFRDLSVDTWHLLAEWAITEQDCRTAVTAIGLVSVKSKYSSSTFLESTTLEAEYAKHCNYNAILDSQPESSYIVEQWCWLYSSAKLLNLSTDNSVPIGAPPMLMDTFIDLHNQLPSNGFVNSVILPETRLQIYLLLLQTRNSAGLNVRSIKRSANRLTNRPLLTQMLEITLKSEEYREYFIYWLRLLPNTERVYALYDCALNVELSARKYLDRIGLLREGNSLIREAFILENAFLAKTVALPTHNHVIVLQLFLTDLDYVLHEDSELARICKDWLARVSYSDDYYHKLLAAAGSSAPQLAKQCKLINIKLSELKLKSARRLLRQVNIQLFDFTESLLQHLDGQED